MQMRKLAAGSLALAAILPLSVDAAPSVSFSSPRNGSTVSGTLSGSECEARGSGISYVRFFVDNKSLSSDAGTPWNCNLDTRRYSDGNHSLRVIAYDSRGAWRSSTVTINIRNSGGGDSGGGGGDSGSAPTVSFSAPAPGGPLSGNVQGPPNCIVTGSNIARVMFYINGVWTNTDGNLDNGLGCWIDTTKYRDGPYTLKAVAYNSAGQTASATRDIVIQNGATGGDRPVVAFSKPTSGATVSGNLYQSPACEVKGSNIAKVQFSLDNTALNTEVNAPYLCNFDTTKFANGSHTLMAVASNAAGSTTTQVAVTIANPVDGDDGDGGDGGSVDAADIVGWAKASVPFRDQAGYNTQVINTYLQAEQIPESGIHGTTLPNGETLRLGKVTDPRDSSRKALAFQVAPNDPKTSGSHRAELRFSPKIANDKVYWAAFRHYVKDWGSFSSSDTAMIAMQLHGGNVAGLSPAIAIYSRGGRNFWIDARGSTASTPSQSNSVSVRSPERPIQFGRWVDFVFKFKLNTSGRGFVQVWMDGQQIWDFKGTVGYNTGSERPYFKFGYYNWTSFTSPRKVLLKSPVIVADPTGSKYTQADLRSYINK